MNEQELLEKVKENPWYLEQIPKELQTEEICLEAIIQDGWALQYVKKQTEKICLTAIRQYGYALEYIQNQTEEMCLEAVKQYGNALYFVKNQTEEMCLEAVRNNPDALRFVKEKYLTKEMLLVIIANFEKCIYKKDIIECFNNMQKRFANEYQLFVLRWCI